MSACVWKNAELFCVFFVCVCVMMMMKLLSSLLLLLLFLCLLCLLLCLKLFTLKKNKANQSTAFPASTLFCRRPLVTVTSGRRHLLLPFFFCGFLFCFLFFFPVDKDIRDELAAPLARSATPDGHTPRRR